jgi:hypothetical protein
MINNSRSNQWKKRRLVWASAIIVFVAVGLLLAYDKLPASSSDSRLQPQVPVVSISSLSDAPPVATQQAGVVPTVDFIAFQETVVVVMQTMPTYTPPPHYPALEERILAEQRRLLMEEAQKTVVVMAHITPVLAPQPTPEPPLTPFPGPPTRIAGAGVIVESPDCIDDLIGTRNKWREYIGTRIVGVCAGSAYFNQKTQRPNGPPYGALLFDDYDTATKIILSGPDLYEVPGQVEWVKVVDAVGERLTLQANTGALFYFDVPTRQWVASQSAPNPTEVHGITGFVECYQNRSPGGSTANYDTCWRGIVDGYYVLVTAGSLLQDGGACGTHGFYRLAAWSPAPGSHVFENIFVVGCGNLHIKEVSGGTVTFDGAATFSVPILFILPTATPTVPPNGTHKYAESPIPTSAAPMPSVSPLATQSP